MARKRGIESSGHTILVIDDQPEYLEATRRLLEREGHVVVAVDGARLGLAEVAARDFDLVLVDYFMPGMTGEEFVVELRETQPTLQVLLQTGYATEQPPRELLRRLQIQGYHDKSEGPEKLCLWIDVSLRAARAARMVERSRSGLKYILDATPHLQRMQPVEDLLQGVLLQMTGLVGAVDAFVALHPAPPAGAVDSCLVLTADDERLETRAATGRFVIGQQVGGDGIDAASVRHAVRTQSVVASESGTVLPLIVGELVLGAIFVDRPLRDDTDRELFEVFASQAAVAIRNATLYEMAALDPLTGTHTRRFFEQGMAREIRLAHRAGAPMGLILVDVDRLKVINDTWGHLAGDRAIAAVAGMLRAATRSTDLVGRIGGDELAIVLPATDHDGVMVVMRRLVDGFAALTASEGSVSFAVSASLGGASLGGRALAADVRGPAPRFEVLMKDLLRAADLALYTAKSGGARAVSPVSWSPGVASEVGLC